MASDLDDLDLFNPVGGSSSQRHGGGKTWSKIKQAVKDTRKLVVSLASHIPASFTFRTEQTADGPITRLYFLGIPPKQRENTLLYVNIPTETMDIIPTLTWCTLLDSFQSTATQMSKEEQLLRERKRLGLYGITSYEMAEDGGQFVFPASNSLFVCKDKNLNADEPIFPFNVDTSLSGARMDPQISPNNSSLVAFVHSNDIWVTSLKTNQEVRLTHSHKGYGNLLADPVSSGVPSFVVQEEFDRYTGYWWQRGSEIDDGAGVYRILYEEVDESGVQILQIFSPMDERGADEYRYPRPGTANAKSCLKLVEFTVSASGQILSPVEKCLYEPLSSLFPSMEYLVRAGWMPNSEFVYVQLLNRPQTKLTLALIPLACFTETRPDDELSGIDGSKYPPIHIIYEDVSDVWINVHDVIHFFPQESDDEVAFIWASEKTGHRHLYRVYSRFAASGSIGNQPSILDSHDGVWMCDCISERALTSGQWEVSTKQVWVDESRQLVYFTGLKDTPLETHLYVVSYQTPGENVKLTQTGYSHSVDFNKDCSLFVTVYSSVASTPMSMAFSILHTDKTVVTKPLGILMPSAPCPDYHSPELFNFESTCGETMYGMYYCPHNQQPGVKYPTLLFVYGGPHVQLASNSFKGLKFLRLHTLAQQGYAVVTIDGRGSCSRGLKFESHIKNRLGTTEIADQVEGLEWLASHVDFIDLNRVVIHGWSYGGYLALMGLAQRPDVFKLAIAGAPVVDWNLYDTGYTERYMDVPNNNAAGYHQGSVLSYIDRFPDEENRLLIVHGLIDENVHFQHTSQLVSALVTACKPHLLQVYPNERHGIRNHEASEHYKTMMLNFLQHNL